MSWSTLFLLTAGLTAPAPLSTTAPQQFDSYKLGYQAAGEAHKPMFVVLNPAVTQVSHGEPISVDDLRHDPKIDSLLNKYVVVVVDTGTDEGRKVHAAFGNKALPYISVIDEQQKKQVYTTSNEVKPTELTKVLTRYQDGAASLAAQIQAPGFCPLCEKNRLKLGL